MNIISQKGFTLIELLVTIAVLAIIMSMAAPAFADMRTKQNLNRSVQELMAVFHDARSKATLERRDVTVELATQQQPTISSDTVDTLYWMPYGTSTLISTPTSLTYNLQGGVKNAATDTTFTICSNGSGSASKTVSVSMMGTVQMIGEGVCP